MKRFYTYEKFDQKSRVREPGAEEARLIEHILKFANYSSLDWVAINKAFDVKCNMQ